MSQRRLTKEDKMKFQKIYDTANNNQQSLGNSSQNIKNQKSVFNGFL